jgi:DNA mismatch endonuclease (patch repair protein)
MGLPALPRMRRVVRTTDVTARSRSAQMALVRSRDTKPELRVRRALHAAGLRYRLHGRGLPGRPDIVFSAKRILIFVHGCFWHQHPDPDCRRARMPKSRLEFWKPKLLGNRERDEAVRAQLEQMGWQVLVVWECEISPAQLEALVRLVRSKAVERSSIRSGTER